MCVSELWQRFFSNLTNFEVSPSYNVPETHETFLNDYIYKTRTLSTVWQNSADE